MATASAERVADCLTESRAVRIVAAELASTERVEVERHLAACSACRRMMSAVLHDSSTDRMVPTFQPRVLGAEMVLADRYRVRRFLGMGAMGEVHEADDLLLGKIVALKTLNARLLGSQRAIERLKLEVAAAHRVTHPNVCRIFDLGIDCRDEALGALMFITMERLEGATLAVLLPDPILGDAERILILGQLAAGLAAAHAAGVIHRDLKPENVMVTRLPDGAVRAVITDFGLAGLGGAIDAPPGTGLSGTPAYAAPERMRGAPATPASDVYSFGLIAHEVVSRKRLLGTKPDVRALPAPWRGRIGRALQSDPTLRPADAGCLLAAFHPAARGFRPRPFWMAGLAVAALALSLAVTRARVAPAVAGNAPLPSLPVAAAPVARLDSAPPLPFKAPEALSLPPIRRRTPVRPRAASEPAQEAASAGGAHASLGPPHSDRLMRDVPFDSSAPHQPAHLLNPF